MKVTTVIVHHHTDHYTNSLIDELRNKTIADPVVFDNGSPTPYERNDVRIVRYPRNLLYVGAVNQIMEFFGEYDYVWVLNSDISNIPNGLLNEMLGHITRTYTVAAITPAVLPSPHEEMKPSDDVTVSYVKYIDWVAPLVRMDAWRSVGGFDPNLKGYGCDIDFCYRARKKGWIFEVVCNRSIKHVMGGTMGVVDAQGQNDLGFMQNYLCKKYNVNDVWSLKYL